MGSLWVLVDRREMVVNGGRDDMTDGQKKKKKKKKKTNLYSRARWMGWEVREG